MPTGSVTYDPRWWGMTTTTTTASFEIRAPMQHAVWTQWVNNTTATGTGSWAYSIPPPRESTQEELDERQRARERAAAVLAEQERQRTLDNERRAAGQERALGLLELVLTDEEKAYRAEHGSIKVRGSEGGLYLVEEGRSVHGNIRLIDEHECHLDTLCVAPSMRDENTNMLVPLADGWVGQVLTIKFNEGHLKRHANYSFRRPCRDGVEAA